MRGYFGIGIMNTKCPMNIGTLWRSANIFGASFIFTIGRRYKHQASDTLNTPCHVPLYNYEDFSDFSAHRPLACQLIGVEQSESSVSIGCFAHPERAVYLLGAEDNGLPKEAVSYCQSVIHIDTRFCLNVAVAGSIVMFDRVGKADKR